MKRFLTYTRLQCKRTARYAPFVFLITLVLCLCLALALQTVVSTDNSDVSHRKIRLGLVGDLSNSYLDFGLTALQSLDSSRFALEILEMTEEQAQAELRAGALDGYVLIPDGFMDDAMRGEVGHLTFVAQENGIDMFTLFKQEVLDMISCLIVESQNGVYGMQNIILDYQVDRAEMWDHFDALTAEYLTLVFQRANTFELQIIGVSEGLSFGGYMLSGLSVLLMLLCGIAYCPLFLRRDMALPKRMNAARYRPSLQIAGEYLAFLAASLFNLAVLSLALAPSAGKLFALIPELSGATTAEALLFLLKCVPSVIILTAWQMLLYELSDSVVGGVLLQFLCSVGLAYVSGCLYPINFFPASIRALASVTPSGLARSYLSALLSDGNAALTLLALLRYAAVLLGLTVCVRRRRIHTS